MSKTFTSRSSVAQSRGRGNTSRQTQTDLGNKTRNQNSTLTPGRPPAVSRGQGQGLNTRSSVVGRGMDRRVPGASGVGRGMDEREVSPQRQQQELGQRMSYQGGYTMVTPNERKRQEISSQAAREEEKYNAFKEKNKLTHVNYVGTAGGGQISQNDARQKLVQDHRSGQVNKVQKQQQWREEKKRHEESTFQQKKDVQRQKAVKNEQMTVQQQRDQQQRWDEDRKRKNEEFLRRFEKKSTQMAKTERSGDSQLGAVGYSAQRNSSKNNNGDTSIFSEQNTGVSSPTRNSSVIDQHVQTLLDMFPDYDEEILRDILIQTDNSLEGAIQLLQG